jgi:hypothetical protein
MNHPVSRSGCHPSLSKEGALSRSPDSRRIGGATFIFGLPIGKEEEKNPVADATGDAIRCKQKSLCNTVVTL